ncbi:MAG: DUF3352 domain-containing protein [Pirellulales bacterium]
MRFRALAPFLVVLSFLASHPIAALARPVTAQLVPQGVVVLLQIRSVPELRSRWQGTALGQMTQDSQIKPLVDSLYGSALEALAPVQQRLGIPPERLLALPTGEFTFALVMPDEGRPAPLIVLDVGENLPEALGALDKAGVSLAEQGAERTEQTVGDTKLVVFRFPGDRSPIAWFERESTIVLSPNVALLEEVAGAWNGKSLSKLSENSGYAAVAEAAGMGQPDPPEVMWFVDPISIARRAMQGNPVGQMMLASAPMLGVDGLLGVGGSLDLAADEYDMIHRVQLLVRSPREGVLDAISLGDAKLVPAAWAPVDVASHTAWQWDLLTTFDRVAAVFDRLPGQQKGALAARLQPLFDPYQLDFRGELLPALDGRISMANWFERPVSLQSQVSLGAVGLRDPEAARQLLARFVAAVEGRLETREFGGVTYYRWLQPGGDSDESTDADGPPRPPRPQPCFAIIGNDLVVADRPSALERAISTAADPKASLGGSIEFKLIMSKLGRLPGGKSPGMFSFTRPEESYRYWYEMATSEATRERLEQQAERNPFFAALHKALTEHPLPPFSVFQQYLAPGGAIITSDDRGFHYTGFTLRRKRE